MATSVTVITLTRNRPDLLRGCIDSVRDLTGNLEIRHLVIVDDCEESMDLLRSIGDKQLDIRFMTRSAEDTTGPSRAAFLRNTAINEVETEWIAYLDDDNRFHPSHLAELLHSANREGTLAAFSYRELLDRSGRPYVKSLDPWIADPEESRRRFLELQQCGIRTAGSSIMRDAAFGPVPTVDTSEWLISTSVAKSVPFATSSSSYSGRETEDDLFLKDLKYHLGIEIAESQMPTLYYYIGGYSSTFGPEAEWRPKT